MEAGRRLVGRGFGGCVAEAMSLARCSERNKTVVSLVSYGHSIEC